MSVVRRTMGHMNHMEICERCEGSGTDPMQAFFDDLVELCRECRGDGLVVSVDVVRGELRELAVSLPLSA
jgi:DnaJ-class molecular chaperone